MRTKNIFKVLALAMLMPATMLTTACSSEDDALNNTANTENTINKGYALPVTVNVSREGDGATRASFDGSKLNFSTGDKLFVEGGSVSTGSFAGTLDYVPATGKFSGTIYTYKKWTDTADELFTAAIANSGYITATLLPNGYKSYGYLSIYNNNTYDDYVITSATYTLATSKADGVAQFSYEKSYNYNDGFALSPDNAILNFTVTGLAASTSVNVSLTSMAYNITGTVTTDAFGNATFAAGIMAGLNLQPFSLTVAGNPITIVSSDKVVEEGMIYNITRNAIPGALVGQFSVSANKKVYFSKGNLQATTTDMGTSWTWAFAENQWSYVGNEAANIAINGNKSVSENGTVDLFGWSTEENYLGIHLSEDDGYNSGDFFDWGSHADVIACIGSGWCTLSKDEWRYLFYTRSDAEDKYGYATVNGVHGIIFLPDAFVDPYKNNGSNAFVGSTNDWDDNLYTEENWALMEKNGAVFLPAAGYRDWGAEVDEVGTDGYYWSSSANGDEDAHYVYFASGDLVVDEYSTSRYCGHSVRLVRPVQ